jgi:hypothetical protein
MSSEPSAGQHARLSFPALFDWKHPRSIPWKGRVHHGPQLPFICAPKSIPNGECISVSISSPRSPRSVPIDEIKFPRSRFHSGWKHCFPAPTGINHELFFLLFSSTPQSGVRPLLEWATESVGREEKTFFKEKKTHKASAQLS